MYKIGRSSERVVDIDGDIEADERKKGLESIDGSQIFKTRKKGSYSFQ